MIFTSQILIFFYPNVMSIPDNNVSVSFNVILEVILMNIGKYWLEISFHTDLDINF